MGNEIISTAKKKLDDEALAFHQTYVNLMGEKTGENGRKVGKEIAKNKKPKQRSAIVGRTVDFDKDFVAPVFEKDEKTVKFLEQSLTGNFLFESLSLKERDNFINAMSILHIPCGIGIIQQGDIGDYFYVVEEGIVSFIVDHVNVGQCSNGSSFGELALLYDCPRAATCLAESAVILWKVDQRTFRHMLASNVQKESEGIREVLKKVKFFNKLDRSILSKISDALMPISFPEGKRIVEKGEIGKVFYIVKKGTVKVHDIGLGDSKYVDQMLGPGDFFGERALLTGEPRAANITAMTDCETLCLSKELFNTTLGSLETLMNAPIRKRRLMGVPTFANAFLEQREISKLTEMFEDQIFQKEHVLVRLGQRIENQAVYFIEEGRVRIMGNTGDVATLSKGDHFGGETIMLPNDALSNNTIIFLEQTTCSVLSKKSVEYVIVSISRLARQSFIKPVLNVNLDNLTLYRVLGAGTFGRVRLACHKETQQSYALKLLSKGQIIESKQEVAVMREKHIMNVIEHPLIVNLINTFQDAQYLYMVLDLVQGGELFSVIHSPDKEGLSYSDSRFYAACILESLSYLHTRNICYRDLKPENILVDKKGYCILIDFGFAKIVSDKTFTLCGTPEYLAPELILSKGHNKGVDYWGLGILLFEMLVGYTPFLPDQTDQITLFKRIVVANLTFPTKGVFTQECEALITRLLKKSQSYRFGCLARGDRDVKEHAFFTGIDWAKLYEKKIKAPWHPRINGHLDHSNFQTYDELENEQPSSMILTPQQQALFRDF